MADEQQAAEAFEHGVVQQFAHEVAAGDRLGHVQVHLVPGEVRAVVAEKDEQVLESVGFARVHFSVHRLDEGAVAHGFHNAARPQDGQTADDAEARVERFRRDVRARRDGNDDAERAVITVPGLHGLDLFGDHAARDGVDGRSARFGRQAGFRHLADSQAAPDFHAWVELLHRSRQGTHMFLCRRFRVRPAHRGIDQGAVRIVRVVAAVLADGARHESRRTADIEHVQGQRDAFGRIELHLAELLAGQEHGRSRLGRRCRAAARRVTAAHELALRHGQFVFHAITSYIHKKRFLP